MAENRLAYFAAFINQERDYQEELNLSLSKAEALVRMAMCQEFFDAADEIKHYYLWVLSDVIENAKLINDASLGLLSEKPSEDIL